VLVRTKMTDVGNHFFRSEIGAKWIGQLKTIQGPTTDCNVFFYAAGSYL
jgi:hypothetical protein